MGWDYQVTCIQTIDQVHVQAGNRRGGLDRMIRWETFKQLTRLTYSLEKNEEVAILDQMKGIQTIDHHSVHVLPEKDDENGMR